MKVTITKKDTLTQVSINIAREISVSRDLTPPDGEVSFVDILPEIYTLHTDIIAATIDNNRRNGISIRCTKGCGTCCHQLVTVSIHEALLLAHLVSMLKPSEQYTIKKSFNHILTKLEEHSILKDLLHYNINQFEDKESITNIQRLYWSLNLDCPFLVENSCSIYQYRPLICREYLVSSEPVNCQESFKNDHLVHRMSLTHGFASAAASFDGIEAIKTRGIPLPIIFLINGLLSYFPRPKTSANEMLKLYFNHVDNYFTKQ